jgi:hypothetical protein
MTGDLLRFAAVLTAACLTLAVLAAKGVEVSLDTPVGLLSLRIP